MVRTPALISSPDARHAVRRDTTRVAVHDVRIPDTGAAPQGMFLGRMVVAWLSVEDMPDAMGYFRGEDRGLALAQRRAYWDAIAWTLLEHSGGPEDDVPPSTAYPSWFQADGRLVQAALSDLDTLAHSWAEFAAWQPDGQAFWVRTRETFDDGAAILDGSPSLDVMHPAMIPVERDGWAPATPR